MKKKPILAELGFLALAIYSFAQVPVISLDETRALDIGRLMEDNNVVIIHPLGVDEEGGNLYILDLRLSHILKIDMTTGKLLRLISSRGQGPSELGMPTCFRVKNNKIYVCDRAYGGVKVFDSNDGRLIKACKISAGMDDIDVLRNGHIILKYLNPAMNSFISEFDDTGNWIRDIVSRILIADIDKGSKYFAETFIRFRLDAQENLILLYPLRRMIAKYDTEGTMLWEKGVENAVLKKSVQTEDSVSTQNGGAVSYTFNVFDLTTNEQGDIIVGHNGGGQIFASNGETMALLKGANLSAFLMSGDKLISILPEGYAFIFQLKL